LRYGLIDLEKTEIDDTDKIASDVYASYVSHDNTRYVYYTKARFGDTAKYDLYVYDVEEEEVRKIEVNVEAKVSVSVDGDKVYYFKDAIYDSGTSYSYGELYVYDVESDESEKIAFDVGVYSLTSNLVNGHIDSDSFFFERYKGSYRKAEDEKNEVLDVCYYDGKETTTVLRDLEIK
jgi:hypothetical protein